MKANRYPHVFQPITIRGADPEESAGIRPHNGAQVQRRWHHGARICWASWSGRPRPAWAGSLWANSGHPRQHLSLAVRDESLQRRLHPRHERAGGESAARTARSCLSSWPILNRGNRASADGQPTAIVSAERPLNPGDNVRTMTRADMDEMKQNFVDCAVRCKHAGFRMILIHCAHNNFLAQWLSPDSNVRTDEYGGCPENRRKYPLEVLKAIRGGRGQRHGHRAARLCHRGHSRRSGI